MSDERPKTSELRSGLSRQVAARGRRGLGQVAILVPLLAAVLIAQGFRTQLFGLNDPVKIVAAVAVAGLGIALARAVGQALQPPMTRRLGPATAGSADFLIRIAAILVVCIVALRVAGVRPEALAAGAGVATLVLGFASQQTLSQVVAGAVILTTRRFRVGDHIAVLSPQLEGTVKTIGLLYTEIQLAKDLVSVPNSSLLSASIIPAKNPASVEMRASLPHGTRPSDAQQTIDETITTATHTGPSVSVNEVADEQFNILVSATPAQASDRQRLIDELTEALARFQSNGGGPARA